MTTSIVVSIMGLIVVICVHIVVIARWSGKIDGYIMSASENFRRIDGEIERLRVSRHEQEGRLQRHEGTLNELIERRRVNRSGGEYPNASR